MNSVSSAAFADTKPHYALLDGLRGVAALLVLWYHVNEGYGFAGYVNGVSDGLVTVFNHGYLAVDFFFILSGFVIGYAYDDRWQHGFTQKAFCKRRLIRLHPLVMLGAVIGLVTFLLQGGVQWDGSHVATSLVMLSLLCAMFMIPAIPGAAYEVRGNGEMFPLNGSAWSLFFEYIGNILYFLLLRRLSTKALGTLGCILGVLLAWFTIGDVTGLGSFGVGWTLDGMNFWGGLLRMLFPYTVGMWISRVFRPAKVKGAFWLCSAALTALFAVPHISSEGLLSLNGAFEAFCIIIAFPSLVWIAASEKATGKRTLQLCKWLGDLSYPLYIVHYPFMYLFYAWLIRHEIYTFEACWQLSLAVMVWNIVLAWICLKLFDEPVRRYLSRRF